MNINAKHKTNTASIFLEYSIIIGVISAALIGMNFYVKRGIQAKIKGMTDYFISDQQVITLYQTNSQTNTITDSSMDTDTYRGGGTKSALLETKNTGSISRTEDVETPFSTSPFVPSAEGNIVIDNRTDDGVYVDPNWETESDIEDLKRQKELLLTKAAALEEAASSIEQEGMDLIPDSVETPCSGKEHGSPKWTVCVKTEAIFRGISGDILLTSGMDLVIEAYNNRKKAASYRADADKIQTKIDSLEKKLKG